MDMVNIELNLGKGKEKWPKNQFLLRSHLISNVPAVKHLFGIARLYKICGNQFVKHNNISWNHLL